MPITVEHLSYIYNPKSAFSKRALDDITLAINDGDFMGVVGQTGSGKSTLVSHFNALTRLQSGTLVINDFDLSAKKLPFKKLRSTVGMVFQYPEYQLFDETVEKDVSFGPKNMGLDAAEISRRAEEAIRMVGLDYEAIRGRSPFELSGGQMRRVALAGVLAMRPDILVLDEPTAGLDPRGKREIMELVRRIKETCSIVVMISHNMDEVARYCNRVAVLENGKLNGVYTPAELFGSAELLAALKLDMPGPVALAHALNGRGYRLNASMSEEALADEIAAQYGGRAKPCAK